MAAQVVADLSRAAGQPQGFVHLPKMEVTPRTLQKEVEVEGFSLPLRVSGNQIEINRKARIKGREV